LTADLAALLDKRLVYISSWSVLCLLAARRGIAVHGILAARVAAESLDTLGARGPGLQAGGIKSHGDLTDAALAGTCALSAAVPSAVLRHRRLQRLL
jgi:hypothetical protein